MSTEPTPAVPGAPAPPVAPPAPAPAPPSDKDNAAFAEMRTKLATSEREKQELADRLTALERKDMDDKQRLEAERNDLTKKVQELTPLQEQHAKIVQGVQKACEDAIAALPQDKQETIKALTQHAPLEERLAAIQAAARAIGAAPISSGTITQPGGNPASGLPGGPEAPKPVEAKDLGKFSWTKAMEGHQATAPVQPDIKSIVDTAVKEALAAQAKAR